jgi:hypothetical protein
MAQQNFKISDELDEKVKKALIDSGLDGKSEFFEEMVNVYNSHLINREEDMHQEIAAYKHINAQSKEILTKTFSHLLSTMDYNFSSVLQEKIFIEEEKKKLLEKSTLLDQELDKMKLHQIEERKVWEAEAKDEIRLLIEQKEHLVTTLEEERVLLEKNKEELSSLVVIAEQTLLVIEENKELRSSLALREKEYKIELSNIDNGYKDEISKINSIHLQGIKLIEDKRFVEVNALKGNIIEHQGLLRNEEKKLFKVSHAFERCEEDLELIVDKAKGDLDLFSSKEEDYRSKFDELSKELSTISSKYNQLLGKVEVFESLEKSKDKK